MVPALPTMRRRAAILSMLSALAPVPALAQAGKPIRLIIPTVAGSGLDAAARAMSVDWSRIAGQPIVIENIVGAGGTIGTAQLVRAPKDGFTLELVSSNHVINPGVYKAIPFDSLKDIAPVTMVGTVPLVLVVAPSLGVKNVRELIDMAKSRPGALNYGTSVGTTVQIGNEQFRQAAKIDVRSIPYKSSAQITTDLMGGQLHYVITSIPPVLALVKSGKLLALGVTTQRRSSSLPDVPTLSEAGLPGFSHDAWIALIAPAGTPAAVLARRASELRQVMAIPSVQAAFESQAISPLPMKDEDLAAYFESELKRHGDITKALGIQLE